MNNEIMTRRSNVGDGWQNIIDSLEEALRRVVPGYEILQIKEKFGGLRYYISYPEGADEVAMQLAQAVISDAENKSLHTCEECGKPANTVSIAHWMRTLCNRHTAEAWAKWAEREDELKGNKQ